MSDNTETLKYQLQKLDSDHSIAVDEEHLRRVVSLLNRLSLNTFDTVSDEVIRVMNDPGEGHTSIPASRLASLVYEKAMRQSRDQSIEMYARLSRKIMLKLSPSFKDNRMKDINGIPITGGQLFRKHLVRLCKDTIDWRWNLERASTRKKLVQDSMYMEENYAARRQGLVVIKFTCEVFKLRMLTDRTMHRLFKTLLVGLDQPEDAGAQVEALCILVSSVGDLLDTEDKARMNLYFHHMEKAKAHLAPGQAMDMLQDILETSGHCWRADNAFTESGFNPPADSGHSPQREVKTKITSVESVEGTRPEQSAKDRKAESPRVAINANAEELGERVRQKLANEEKEHQVGSAMVETDQSGEILPGEEKASTTPPSAVPFALPGGRPAPLNVSSTQRPISQPLPYLLARAFFIDNLRTVTYPEGIKSPSVALNVNAKDGKFRYDRDFLMQFMAICKEKPDMLPPLEAIGLEPQDPASFQMTRGGSGRHRQASGASTPSRQDSGSFGAGTGFGGKGSFSMGQFGTGITGKPQAEASGPVKVNHRRAKRGKAGRASETSQGRTSGLGS